MRSATDRLGPARALPLAPAAALVAHLRNPMRRNAYALTVSTALTSVVGFVFWLVAARWFPAAALGTGAALTSMISFLATVSTLGLGNGLVRFLASARATARRLIATCYAICAATAALAAAVFVLGQPVWARELGLLRSSPWAVAAFVAATAVWVLFVLQDQVLIGLRRAVWVPVLNGAHSVAKLALLPLLPVLPLVALSAEWAILGATVLPAAVLVLVVVVVAGRRLARPGEVSEPDGFSVARLARFAAGDHISSLIALATFSLMIIVVIEGAGAEAGGYYFLAYMMANALYLVSTNMGSALVAEAAQFPDRAVALGRQAALNAARLVVPMAVLACLLAPQVLTLVGRDYSAEGTPLLRLLVLSAIPEIIVAISLSMARVRRAIGLMIGINSAVAIGILGGSSLVLGRWGLTGVGVVWLGTLTVVALALLATGRTGLTEAARPADQRGR